MGIEGPKSPERQSELESIRDEAVEDALVRLEVPTDMSDSAESYKDETGKLLTAYFDACAETSISFIKASSETGRQFLNSSEETGKEMLKMYEGTPVYEEREQRVRQLERENQERINKLVSRDLNLTREKFISALESRGIDTTYAQKAADALHKKIIRDLNQI